jgi:hypothetical protein
VINRKTFPIPEKFHTLIKFEAIKSGKTITSYMSEVAEEIEERNITFREFIKSGERKNEKKFIPRF